MKRVVPVNVHIPPPQRRSTEIPRGDGVQKEVRWPEPIYTHVGYVFESGFSPGMISPISMIFSMLNKQ